MTYEEAKKNQAKLYYQARRKGTKFSLFQFRKRKLKEPDYRKNYNRAYYLKHKKEMNARSSKWMKENKDKINAYHRSRRNKEVKISLDN